MDFTRSEAKVDLDKGDPHHDHIHIDWVDYGRSLAASSLSKLFSSFKFINDQGVTTEKRVGTYDQKLIMYWNSGARTGTLSEFEVGFGELNIAFASQSTRLAGLKLDDFKAMYTTSPPISPSPTLPTPCQPNVAPVQPEKHTDSTWYNREGVLVHPDAPLGSGGLGFFGRAGSTESFRVSGGIPDPRSPASRTLDPLKLERFQNGSELG